MTVAPSSPRSTRQTFRTIFRVLTILALVVFVSAWLVYAWFARSATLAQRIEPYQPAMAELLGEPGLTLGSPQVFVIRDDNAFLEGTGEAGERFLNETYLTQNGIYPLQLKEVAFWRNLISLGATAGFIVCGVLWLVLRARQSVAK
jgi:hypothetical protein